MHTLKDYICGVALLLLAAASLAAFILELSGPGRISALIGFGAFFLMCLYPIAAVTAFWIYMSLQGRRRRREVARKKSDMGN
jgi:hypothetical protein